MIKIGIIGDFDKEFIPHIATMNSLSYSSKKIGVDISIDWIDTESLNDSGLMIKNFNGIWISPGKLYKSVKGALNGIKTARESNIPTLGTCRGFQHLMIEFGRYVLNLSGEEIEKNDPFLSKIVSMRSNCSLEDKWIDIEINNNSLAYRFYNKSMIQEQDVCSFEINKEYRKNIELKGLLITGIDTDGMPRIVEFIKNDFYIGTLFVPQLNSTIESPHPIVTGFLNAVQNNMT
jgi:CTP synthase (UTP-ammonia lyase)